MALTCTYKSTGSSTDYVETTIHILGSSSGTFNVAEGGVRFSIQTSERDQHARWSPMTAEFTLMIEDDNDAAAEAFIDDITSTSAESFFVNIYIGGALKYVGIISAEGSEWADNANTREFRVLAYDGMGRLEGKNYADVSDTPYGGYETIEHAINFAMSKVGTNSYFMSEPFLLILHSSTADGQTVSGNPMANQRVDFTVWQEKGDNPNIITFRSAREVMEDIMIAYGLCLRYVGPYFLLYEPALLATGGTAYAYDASGGYIGTQAVGGAVSIDNNKTLSGGDRKGGSGFSALPPYYKAQVKYDHGDQVTNLLYGLSYLGYNHYQDPGPDGSLIEVGSVTVEAGEVVVLRFEGKLRTNSKFYGGTPPPMWRNHRYHFRIKLKTVTTTSSYHWRRDFNAYDFYTTTFSDFSNSYWDANEEVYFDFVTQINDEKNRDYNIFASIGFDTIPLEQNKLHEVFFGFEVINVFDENNNLVDLGSNPDRCDWEFSDLSLEAVTDGTIIKRPTATDYTALGDHANSDFYQATTHIGDGPGKTSIGRLQALIGGEWKDTATWGGARLIQKTVGQILGNRETSVGVLTGGVYSLDYWFDKAFTYEGKTYLPMSISYTGGRDEWAGEWVEFKVGSGGTSKINRRLRKELVPLPKSGRLPDDERLEDRIIEIKTGTSGYQKGIGGVTSVALLNAARYDLWSEGDKVNIIDPVIGYVDELTLTADVNAGDTSIQIEAWEPSEDFPPRSYLRLEKEFDASLRRRYYQLHTDLDGVTWPITVMPLPDPAIGQVEVSKRIQVYKNGVKLVYLLSVDSSTQYHKGFGIDIDTVNNIILYETAEHAILEFYGEK